MLALAVVKASCVVEEQGCHRRSFDPTLHLYADVVLGCQNQYPFGTSRHLARRLKTLPSDGGLARQVVDSEDVCQRNRNVCGVCFVTKTLSYIFAPGCG